MHWLPVFFAFFCTFCCSPLLASAPRNPHDIVTTRTFRHKISNDIFMDPCKSGDNQGDIQVDIAAVSPHSYPRSSSRVRGKTDTRSPGCSYQGTKYNHADQVITPEPCLNCTCKRGVLLCFLKVCSALLHHSVGHDCQIVREAGQCCPVVKCESRRSAGNNNDSRPRLNDDVEGSMPYTELPTTTVGDALPSDEIASPLSTSESIASTTVKQKGTETLSADITEDVELGIDEPTTLAPISTSRAAPHYPLSLPNGSEAAGPEVAATHFPPLDSGDAKPGLSPLFAHMPSSSPSVAEGPDLTTVASLTHAPPPQPGSPVTAEWREESSGRLSLESETGTLPTDTADKKSDITPPLKNTVTTSEVKSSTNSTANKTNGAESDPDFKIQPNQLYVSWVNNLRNVSKQDTGAEEGHRVETILDGIIQALDTRVNQELPSEPRDTLVGKSRITDEQVAPPSQVAAKQPTSRREDENHEPAYSEPKNASSFLVKENRKDDDENSFQLPPIPTGYISNTEYLVHRDQHRPINYHSGHSGNKNANGHSSGDSGRNNSTSGSPLKHPQAYGNTVGRIQVSSKIGFSMTPDQSALLNIAHLPRPHTSGSFLVVGEDNDVRKGTVEDDTPGAHVEIITAKTPFLEANVSNSNSFLINLSPTTLQVGSPSASDASFYASNEPVYEPEKKGSVFAASLTPHKPMPSFPTYFAPANNQWKIVTQNHSPKSKLPKSDEPSPADVYSPTGPELTRRSGFVMETSEEKRNEEGSYGEASELLPAVAYEPSKVILSSDALETSPFLKRNGNIVIRPITGTAEQRSEAMAASQVQRSGVSPEQAPASHVAPLSLTATPASYTLKPVFHEAQGLQPEASALKLMSDAEAAGDTATASERTAPEIKLERSDTDFSEHQFFARYPAVPSSVHSPQYQRPSFPFDPTPSVENSFPLPPPNPVSHFATSGISRSDQVFTHPGRQPPQTDSITPLIPPKPGTFLRTPTSQFLPPNRLGLPQSGMYNRVPQSKITAPWNFSHPPRNGPPQHQMIGPVMGPRNPPHAMSPSQPHKKTPLPVKFHFLNPYSLSEQQLKSQQPLIPQHSQLVPSVVAPPEVLVSHSAAADAYSNGMIADSHASNPSKIYALPTNVKVDPLPAVTPFVSSPTPTVFPVMHYSEKAVEKDGNSFATVQAEASTKSVLELVMNAGTAWNANEVTPSVASHVTNTPTTPAPVPSPTTPFSKPIWKLSTKKHLLFSASTAAPSSPAPSVTTTATPATTTEAVQRGSNPWDMIRVSGCNIYGTFYQVDQSISELSSACKKCFCSSFGVQCSKVC